MDKRKINISEEEFQQYLENKMTDTERNSFERKLQKHPFEAEAMEGFQTVSPEELSKDLHDLKTVLISEKQKFRYRYRAAAATIILLLASGIIWVQLKNETPVQSVTESNPALKKDTSIESTITPVQETAIGNKLNIIVEEEESTEPAEIKIPDPDKIASGELELKLAPASTNTQFHTVIADENRDEQPNIQEIAERQEKRIADIKFQDDAGLKNNLTDFHLGMENTEQVNTINIRDEKRARLSNSQVNMVKTLAVAEENGNSFDSAQLNKPAFAQMEFNPILQPADTVRIIGKTQYQSNTGPITVQGIANPVTKFTVTSSKTVSSDLHPVGGMEEFEKYLEENAILPDGYSKRREVVKLVAMFDELGNATRFTNLNDADSTVFDLAKKLINDGPEWSPEIRNSKRVTSEKELKIVFRKK